MSASPTRISPPNSAPAAPVPLDRAQEAEATGGRQMPAADWSPSLQTTLDRPPSALPVWLTLGALVFCTGLGFWAAWGNIEEVSTARGRLVPKGEAHKVNAVDIGRVVALTVREGDRVQPGQVIAQLDSQLDATEITRLEQRLNSLRLEMIQQQQLRATFDAEARNRQTFAAANDRSVRAALAVERSRADSTRSLLAELEVSNRDYADRVERLKPYVEEGAIAREQLFGAEQSLAQSKQEILRVQGELTRSQREIARLQAEVTKAATTDRSSLDGLARQKQQVDLEISRLRGQMTETTVAIKAAQVQRRRRSILAPVGGRVVDLGVLHPGEVVQPGQLVAAIAPVNRPLVLSALLPVSESGAIALGMAVKLKFDAYPYQDYGLLHGKLSRISLDSKADDQLGQVYRIEVTVDRPIVTAGRKPIALQAGQTATAEIVRRRRRLLDILLEPFAKMQRGGLQL